MSVNAAQLALRDLAEIERSAVEASKIKVKIRNVDRYMSPPADTIYPLEYAFHLLGDVHGKRVLDLGCGSGENVVPLLRRGADVLAIDISPELVAAAHTRLEMAGLEAPVWAGTAYDTGLESESIDIVFSMSLLHHLDIPAVREEIRRVLKPGGVLIIKEPVRFSRLYGRIRSWLPDPMDTSTYEHPLTRNELVNVEKGFEVQNLRYFRLPFVPVVERVLGKHSRGIWSVSDVTLRWAQLLSQFATLVVARMQKQAEPQVRMGAWAHAA
ncbi:MAG TPA: methyltransferase domain-containing protein [Candidatus Aquilonibacter sp.]|nr:methyltransferase domain-containing protein [Candidatus Aquilonibacter sp.]